MQKAQCEITGAVVDSDKAKTVVYVKLSDTVQLMVVPQYYQGGAWNQGHVSEAGEKKIVDALDNLSGPAAKPQTSKT